MRHWLKALVVASASWLGCTDMEELSGSAAPREGMTQTEQPIVGGTAALPFTNPWHVRIHRTTEDVICNGALISLGWVLTTARCVQGMEASDLRLTVGTLYRSSSRDGITAQGFTPRRVILHPLYKNDLTAEGSDYDIALLELPSPVVPSTVVSPVALSHTDPAAELAGDLSGFGLTGEQGNYQAVLRRVYVNVLPRRSCRKAYGNQAITYRQFCSGMEAGGRGGCWGDSGAPMVTSVSFPARLVGLYSYSRGCAQQGAPDVMTNVFAFADWIDNVTGQPL